MTARYTTLINDCTAHALLGYNAGDSATFYTTLILITYIHSQYMQITLPPALLQLHLFIPNLTTAIHFL